MTGMRFDLRETGLQREDLRYSPADLSEKPSQNLIPANDLCSTKVDTGINTKSLHLVLKGLAATDQPGKEHVESYLRHVHRRNFKVRTLYGIMTAPRLRQW